MSLSRLGCFFFLNCESVRSTVHVNVMSRSLSLVDLVGIFRPD